MKLEEQLCNLELAKRLKELKVKQESEFLWIDRLLDRTEMNETAIVPIWIDVLDEWAHDCEIIACAFTVAELGEMLPRGTATRKGWGLEDGYVMFDNEANRILSTKTEADARAKMLIYLLENKLMKEVNSG